jgi:hypothetical protein
MPQNPTHRSYTKRDLRYLLADPAVDLDAPKVDPIGRTAFDNKIKRIIEKRGEAAGFDLVQWTSWRQGMIPAQVCELILTSTI